MKQYQISRTSKNNTLCKINDGSRTYDLRRVLRTSFDIGYRNIKAVNLAESILADLYNENSPKYFGVLTLSKEIAPNFVEKELCRMDSDEEIILTDEYLHYWIARNVNLLFCTPIGYMMERELVLQSYWSRREGILVESSRRSIKRYEAALKFWIRS